MKKVVVLFCIICLVVADGGLGGGSLGFNPLNIRQFAEWRPKGKEGNQKQDENKPKNIALDILVHIQDIGDMGGHDNQWVGTKGQWRRLEGFFINPIRTSDDFYLEYFAHLQDSGDTAWVRQGQFIGTRGQYRRLEGFGIRVAGKDAWKYNVYYSAHLQQKGDTAEYKNGEFCGTRGEFRRVEAIFVRLERICLYL